MSLPSFVPVELWWSTISSGAMCDPQQVTVLQLRPLTIYHKKSLRCTCKTSHCSAGFPLATTESVAMEGSNLLLPTAHGMGQKLLHRCTQHIKPSILWVQCGGHDIEYQFGSVIPVISYSYIPKSWQARFPHGTTVIQVMDHGFVNPRWLGDPIQCTQSPETARGSRHPRWSQRETRWCRKWSKWCLNASPSPRSMGYGCVSLDQPYGMMLGDISWEFIMTNVVCKYIKHDIMI
jgi:hypothetical protein